MNDPLQQAIERSRDFEPDPGNAWQGPVFALQMEPKFREALAIADAALANVLDVAKHGSEPYKVISGPALGEYVSKVRAEMCKLFEEDHHD